MRYSLPFLLICLFSACAEKKERDERKPNVIFISIDDLRPALGVYEDPIAISPNLDAFAAEAMTFRQTFAQSAVCAPSRASLMTGLRPDSTRVWHLGDKFREINPAAVTMPQHFSKYGYHTINVGKIFHNYMPDSISWDEADLRPAKYLKKEWLGRDGETFYISEEVAASQVIKRDSLLKLRPVRYADGWNTGPAWEAADVHDTMYYDGAQNELVKRRISELAKEKEPFYLGLGYFRPHLPFAVPKKYWDLYDRTSMPLADNLDVPQKAPEWTMNSMYELRHYDGFGHIGHPQSDFVMNSDTARILRHGYYASVSYVDAVFGNLMEHLKEIGIYEESIIVVWGDHGWKLGDHNSWGKMTNYNIDLEVPLLVKYPGQKKKGVQTFEMVEMVDLFPSLCDLSGIPIPDYMQGHSFVPLLENPKLKWKDAVFSQFHRRPRVAFDGGRYMGYSMNTKEYHYIEWYQWDAKNGLKKDFVASELYDRKNDPKESLNLAKDSMYVDLIKSLSQQLEEGWESALPKY